jgi:anti-sigma regulatory factor (Ser/Thr protein kinase)
MILNLTPPEAFDLIDLPRIIREDEVIPSDFPDCPNSCYQPEYDWLFQYERQIAAFLAPWLRAYRYELIGEKGILCEALSNAFSHGHRKDRFKAIHVRVWLGRKGLLIEIKDSGKGFNIRETYESYLKRKPYYALAGNGLRLMTQSKSFGIFHHAGGTAFCMIHLFGLSLSELPPRYILIPPHTHDCGGRASACFKTHQNIR